MQLSLAGIVLDGLLLSAGLAVVILGSLWFNPRLWAQDYPPEVKPRIAPLTPLEKRQQRLVAVAFLAVVAVALGLSIHRLHGENNGAPSLAAVFLNSYGVLMIANLFDLLVIDYLVLMVLHPRFALIPGTEAALASVNLVRFHFVGFLKGCVYTALVSFAVAALVTVF